MKKLIKQYGDSAVVVLTKEDLKVYDLKVGDTIHIFTDESLEEVGRRFEKVIIEDIDKQDEELEEDQKRKREQSYEDYVKYEKDGIERGFNRERFIMTKAQHKIYQKYLKKDDHTKKDKDEFYEWWEKVIKEFRDKRGVKK